MRSITKIICILRITIANNYTAINSHIYKDAGGGTNANIHARYKYRIFNYHCVGNCFLSSVDISVVYV